MSSIDIDLFTRHIFYQFGSIYGYLHQLRQRGSDDFFDDDLATMLRNIRTGSGGSFTNKLDSRTGYLKDGLDGNRELSKSMIVQNFVNEINRHSPVLQMPPPIGFIDVYRSLNIDSNQLQLLYQKLLLNDIDNEILPHPLPFSASWTSELSTTGGWESNNLILKIQLPINYPYLALSCPPNVCPMDSSTVESLLRDMYYWILQVINQSQMELLIMPSYFKLSGDYYARQLYDGELQLHVTVKPVLMLDSDQRKYLKVDEEITWP